MRPPEIRVLALEQERSMLRWGLRGFMFLTGGAGVLAFVGALLSHSFGLFEAALVPTAAVMLGVFCGWTARRGHPRRAALQLAWGTLALDIGFAFTAPFALTTQMVVPFVAISLALPHVSNSQLWKLLTGALVTVVGILVIAFGLRVSVVIPPHWERVMSVGFLLFPQGMLLLVFVQFGRQIRLHLSAVIRANLALHDALSFRDDFLTQAHHELRTPLTALKLQLQDLHRQSAPGTSPGRVSVPERKLVEVRYQLERLRELIERLLDVTSLNAQRLVLDRREVDFTAVVREVVNRHSPQHRSTGVQVTILGDESVRGRWDRVRLEQVVTNLLTNALKYGAGKPVELSIRGNGTEAVFQVKDHGIGIAPEDQRRIFEQFERTTQTRNHGGFGVGLWIVHQLVAAHGGQLNLASSPNEGSTFTVHLPDRIPAEGGDVSSSEATTPHLHRLSG